MQQDGINWSPRLTYWSVQVAFQVAAVAAAIWTPSVILGAVVVSFAYWPYSALSGTSMWGHPPNSPEWRTWCLKWFFVCVFATCPLMLSKIFKIRFWVRQCSGTVLHLFLAGNILSALAMDMTGDIEKWNGAAAAMLTVSLALKVTETVYCGEALLERGEDGLCVFFRTTPLPWVASYTIWNAMLAWQSGFHNLVQGVFIWCFMLLCTYVTGHERPIADTFPFALIASTASYVMVAVFAGLAYPLQRSLTDPPRELYWFSIFLTYTNVLALAVQLAADLYALSSASPNKNRASRSMEVPESETGDKSAHISYFPMPIPSPPPSRPPRGGFGECCR